MSVNPSETVEERLTRQFYEWEMPGRGWQVWAGPVDPEPPFRPFFGHYDQGRPNKIVDDGRKPTLLSTIAGRLRGVFGQASNTEQASIELRDDELKAYSFQDDR